MFYYGGQINERADRWKKKIGDWFDAWPASALMALAVRCPQTPFLRSFRIHQEE